MVLHSSNISNLTCVPRDWPIQNISGPHTTVPKRQFHNKVKSGCLTCKQRRVKCDEAKPTCLRCWASRKQCLGYPKLPEPKIFELSSSTTRSATTTSSSTERNEDGDIARSLRSSSLATDQFSLILPNLRQQQSSPSNTNTDFSFNSNPSTTPLSILSSLSSQFSSSQEKYSHDFFRHWLSTYTAPRADTVPDLWTIHFPQLGSAIPALHSVMLANGLIGTSLLRKESPSQYHQARMQALEHVNNAISYLTTHPQPPHIITMIAWLFWLLEMSQGFFASSTMHIESALKVGTSSLTARNSPEETALVQLLRDVRATTSHTAGLERAYPFVLSRATPPRQRMAACVPIFHKTISRILVAQLNLAFENPLSSLSPLSPTDKATLLSSLRRLRRELEWLSDRWTWRISQPTSSTTTSPPSPSSEEEEETIRAAALLGSEGDESEMFSPYLDEIASGEHTVEFLQMAFARAIPIFVSRAGHDDLEMRQDLVELLQTVSCAVDGEG